ncbi:hypothetical protein BU15DRAFT_83998 [Melanogaster broomeanus]|nr:hypothetical protein BU15DRAFT_83998 [Melanogaster broomeanus]
MAYPEASNMLAPLSTPAAVHLVPYLRGGGGDSTQPSETELVVPSPLLSPLSGVLPPVPYGVTLIVIPPLLSSVILALSAPVIRRLNTTSVPPVYVPDPPNILTEDPLSPEFPPTLLNLCGDALCAASQHFRALHDSFPSQHLCGAKSIYIPSVPAYRFPLWVVSLLGEVAAASQKLQCWADALGWLTKVLDQCPAHEQEIINQCRIRFHHIPWDASVMYELLSSRCSLSGHHLAIFLSIQWLYDDQLDAGLAVIQHELGVDSRVVLVDTLFMTHLRLARGRQDHYQPRSDSALDQALLCGKVDCLEVPVNPGGSHWAGIQVNIKERTFGYRDGYNVGKMADRADLELLDWFLSAFGHVSLLLCSSIIPTPRQTDSHSCGVVLLSSLAAHHLHWVPWSQSRAAIHRMEWFLKISDRWLNLANSCLTSTNIDEQVMANKIEPAAVVIHSSSATTNRSASICISEDPATWAVAPYRSLPVLPPSPHTFKRASSSKIEPAAVVIHSSLATTNRSASIRISEDPATQAVAPYRSLPVLPPSPHTFKRASSPHSSASACSDCESSGCKLPSRPSSLKRPRHSQSASSQQNSWAYQKELKRHARTEGFIPNKRCLDQFQAKVQLDDPHAEFRHDDILAVRCSSCAEWLCMRVPYDCQRWKLHRATQKCQGRQSSKLISKSLRMFFTRPLSAPSNSPPVNNSSLHQPPLPCKGLRANSDQAIARYLRRSSTLGGGAPSRQRIAHELFPDLAQDAHSWKALDSAQRDMVLSKEQASFRWLNRHNIGAVFSAECEEMCPPIDGERATCRHCQQLRKLHIFQNVLNRKEPPERNMKFVPKAYRCQELGSIYLKYEGVRQLIEQDDGNSPWLRFAKGVSDGLYKNQNVLLGMVEAMVKKAERLALGQGLQNMRYTDVFDSFCSLLASHSPRHIRLFITTLVAGPFGACGTSSLHVRYLNH